MPGITSTSLKQAIREVGTSPQMRLKMLKRLLEAKPLVRILECAQWLDGTDRGDRVRRKRPQRSGIRRDLVE